MSGPTVWSLRRGCFRMVLATPRRSRLHSALSRRSWRLRDGRAQPRGNRCRRCNGSTRGRPGGHSPGRVLQLDAVLSVGYRVNSKRGAQFRIWATGKRREHLLRGYTLDERRLREKGIGEMEQAVGAARAHAEAARAGHGRGAGTNHQSHRHDGGPMAREASPGGLVRRRDRGSPRAFVIGSDDDLGSAGEPRSPGSAEARAARALEIEGLWRSGSRGPRTAGGPDDRAGPRPVTRHPLPVRRLHQAV